VVNDDPVYLMRLHAISAPQELGSVKLACQALDIPCSTLYRWRKQWIRYGAEPPSKPCWPAP
jgi:transposase-like protein